jgi:hypothetical protein
MLVSRKRTLILIIGAIAIAALATLAYGAWYPRPYYRYGGGRVWLEEHPDACWNGLLRAPVFQFRVPPFRSARRWQPSEEQIREELRHQANLNLSEEEISRIIQCCVSCDTHQSRKSEPGGAANRSQPAGSGTNRASSAAGPGG